MFVKCQDICAAVEKWAPKQLAESWDNVGLQVGDLQQPVARLLVALDITSDVIRQAKQRQAEMIISHHPLIFKPLKNVCAHSTIGASVMEVIKHNIAAYSAHTNLDSTTGGISELLAEIIGITETKILDAGYREKLVKLAVFIPAGYETAVRNAMLDAGAGWIGNYSHCSFLTKGMGTFMPEAGTTPFNGVLGKLEYAEEYRLETIIREKQVADIVNAMLAAHPYEEVAYDLYPLVNTGEGFGLGRIGRIPEPLTVEAFLQQVKAALGCSSMKVVGNLTQEVQTIAVCGGSGASLISKAKAAGADVYITGDIKYHEAQEALAAGLVLIDAGHFATEHMIVSALVQYLRNYSANAGWKLEVYAAEETDVFNVV